MGAKAMSPIKRLGAWLVRVNNTVYQAATDGFALGISPQTSGHDPLIKTDSANPPTTIRSRFTVTVESLRFSPASPVRKGDYWKAEGCTDAVYWIPLEP